MSKPKKHTVGISLDQALSESIERVQTNMTNPIFNQVTNFNILEEWEGRGFPVIYARLQSPTTPSKDKEPVEEFRFHLEKNNKYRVESMVYCEHGLIWRLNGELNFTPSANVRSVRTMIEASGTVNAP